MEVSLIPMPESLCLNNNDQYIYIYIYIFQASLFFLIVISSDFFLLQALAILPKEFEKHLEKNMFLYGVKLVFFQQKFSTFAK
jgi:hypothetical protein